MKKKTTGRILSIVLAVCMLLTAAPLAGFVGLQLPDLKLPEKIKAAVSNVADSIAAIGNEASAAVVASGTCGKDGDNLTWTLDDAGLLTIEGTGAMAEWSQSLDVPWDTHRSSVKQVKIGSGVTSIGDYAFRFCYAMTEIDLSACTALGSIGYEAFSYCALTEIDLSACTNLQFIGDRAFYYCNVLTAIHIANDNHYYRSPDGVLYDKYMSELICYPAGKTETSYTVSATVTIIRANAFNNCDALMEIDLSACTRMRYIKDFAIYNCDALTDICIANDNQYYTSQNGVLFNKAMTELIQYPVGKADTSYTVPATVTEICDYAFQHSIALEEINFSACADLYSIGRMAFYRCDALMEIDLSACTNLFNIEDFAFEFCTALTEVDLSACTSLRAIGQLAFHDIDALTAIKIGSMDCEISDSAINGAYTIDSGATIYGYIGSTAEAYATKYNRTFIDLTLHTHTPGEWVVTQAAGCTTNGARSRSCTDCLELLETENIPALGHAWNDGVITTPATCTVAGVKTFICTRCSATRTEIIPATDHTVVNDAAVAPTCTETGLTAGTHCSVCKTVITAQTVVAALGHIDDNEDSVCDRCGAELETEDPSENCSCSCHKSGFSGFFWKIKRIFYKLFRVESKRYCECGEAHW